MPQVVILDNLGSNPRLPLMERIDEFRGRYYFLSNFSTEGGVKPTLEHQFQALKATTVEDAIFVMSAFNTNGEPDPGLSKRRGRSIPYREDWDDVKLDVMYDLLVVKFSVKPIRQKLLDTGEAILIEGNAWGDKYWGMCNGKGHNYLGQLLMLVRKEASGR